MYRDISILDIVCLCQFIIGPLLAPENFPHHLTCLRKDGRVTKSEVARVLKNCAAARKKYRLKDVNTVLPLVEYLNLCFLEKGTEDVYLFPAHLQPAKANEMWVKDVQLKVYVGRQVRCSSQTSIVSPGSFNFFQCRACVTLDKAARLWRDGMILHKAGAREYPVECLCVMSKHLREVDFIVRGREGSQSDCLSFLQAVMGLWNDIMLQHSPGTELETCYLSKAHIEAHRENPAAYSEKEVQEASARGPNALVRVSIEDDDISDSLKDLLVSGALVADL